MEELISFLLKNFYVVIVIVGLIYSMFFRKSPLEKPPANRPNPRPVNRMPDFGGSPAFPPKPRRAEEPIPVEKPRPSVQEEPRPQRQTVYRSPEAAAPVSAEPARDRRALEPAPAPTPAPALVAAPAMQAEETQDSRIREDMARAVVWAEILGPPRARRPFRR